MTAPSASGREVGDLDGRHRRRRVGERAGPAEVVEVVARALLVPAARAEAGDRAVDGVRSRVVRADAEPRRDARAEAFEHDVRARDERTRQLSAGVGLEIADDRLLAGVERVVPRRSASRAAGRRPAASIRTTRAPSRCSSRPAYAPGR